MFVVAGSPYNDNSTHVTVALSYVQQTITITMGSCISPGSELTTELFLQFLCAVLNSFERENLERGMLRVGAHGQVNHVFVCGWQDAGV